MNDLLQELCESRANCEDSLSGVVIYEDTLTRDRAVQLCDRLVQKFWTDLAIKFSWWRFEYLHEEKLARLAAAEASVADMVVFSTHGQRELPPPVQSWIEANLPSRRNRPSALVALVGLESDSLKGFTPVHVYLRDVAQRSRMDFLTHVPQRGEGSKELFAESMAGRAGKVTNVLDGILQRPSAPLRWGINE